MDINLAGLILDAADLERESAFWHRLLGGSITRTETHHFLRIGGLPVIVIQHAPDHVPPQWPDGTSQQMHADFTTDDVATAEQRVLNTGGRRLQPAADTGIPSQTSSRVFASPAGHPFCVRPV